MVYWLSCPMKFELDFMATIWPLIPLLQELERIENLAAGKTLDECNGTDGCKTDEQGPEGC